MKKHNIYKNPTQITPPTFTNAFDEILRDFPQLLHRTNKTPKINHGIEHHIVTTGPPVFAKSRRYHGDKYKALRTEIDQLLDEGVIKSSNSPAWSTPIHLVPKKNESYRPVRDFRKLNAITVPDKYPLPFLLDFCNMIMLCA